jgi:hypothetical protein
MRGLVTFSTVMAEARPGSIGQFKKAKVADSPVHHARLMHDAAV